MNATSEPTLVKAVVAFLAGLACTILGAWDNIMTALVIPVAMLGIGRSAMKQSLSDPAALLIGFLTATAASLFGGWVRVMRALHLMLALGTASCVGQAVQRAIAAARPRFVARFARISLRPCGWSRARERNPYPPQRSRRRPRWCQPRSLERSPLPSKGGMPITAPDPRARRLGL